jgi:hypothetical protein
MDLAILTANANTGSNPIIGLAEDKLIEDKQLIDSFAFVAVKTEIKVSYRLFTFFCNYCKYLQVCYHYSRNLAASHVLTVQFKLSQPTSLRSV